MKTRIVFGLAVALSAWGGFSFSAHADVSHAASQPVGAVVYEVVAVTGKVRVAPDTADATKDEGWTLVKVGDVLQRGQAVRTALRSKLKLAARPADPPTVLLIEQSSLLQIAELTIVEGAQKSRINLSYGAVRAGVAEGGTRSDMEIQSPEATLSKKGTDIFRFESHDGRFRISLTPEGRGLLQTMMTRGSQMGVSRFVTAGQFVTQQMARAIDNMKFERTINVSDQFGLGGSDQLFTMLNNHGFGFLLPQGNGAGGVANNGLRGDFGGDPSGNGGPPTNNQGNTNPFTTQQRQTPAVPFGNFGIGQGTLPPAFGQRFGTARAAGAKAFARPARISR